MRTAAKKTSANIRHGAALALLPLLLAGCNETASDKLPTRMLVLDGELLVQGSNAVMTVSMGKERSTVVVVLQGGDTLRVSDGTSNVRMSYISDSLFGAYYRTTMPLNALATYSVSLFRVDDNATYDSTFPPIPAAFALTAPAASQLVTLSANSQVTVQWDNAVPGLGLAVETPCVWRVAAPGMAVTLEDRMTRSAPAMLSVEAVQRMKTFDFAPVIEEQRDGIEATNTTATVSLVSCAPVVTLSTSNIGTANVALSPASGLETVRTDKRTFRLVP